LPQVFLSPSYRQVRMQGRNQPEDPIQFPTLVVRSPNELIRAGPRKGSLFTGPVYTPGPNDLSTKDIEAKIKEINAAAAKKIDEEKKKVAKELAVTVEEADQKEIEKEIDNAIAIAEEAIAISEEIAVEELDDITNAIAEGIVTEELEVATDLLAEEIVAEEIEALTDKLAAQIVLEELEEEIAEEALIGDISSAVDMNVLETDDFVTESNVTEKNLVEDQDISDSDEGSGNVDVNVDFGDIQEV